MFCCQTFESTEIKAAFMGWHQRSDCTSNSRHLPNGKIHTTLHLENLHQECPVETRFAWNPGVKTENFHRDISSTLTLFWNLENVCLLGTFLRISCWCWVQNEYLHMSALHRSWPVSKRMCFPVLLFSCSWFRGLFEMKNERFELFHCARLLPKYHVSCLWLPFFGAYALLVVANWVFSNIGIETN